MSLLYIKDLKVSYGGIEAIKGISLTVEKGEIVTLIGANGAGKSTTLRAVSGLVPMRNGTITYDGQVISGQTPQKIVSEGIGMVPEGRRIFPNLTVFVIEHHMDLVMGISDRIYVVEFGKLIAEGTPQEIQNNQAVIDAYLGGNDE